MRFYNSSYLALENVEKQGNSTLVSTVIKHRIKYANSVSATLSCSVLSAENCFSFSCCTPLPPSLSLSHFLSCCFFCLCFVCVCVFGIIYTLRILCILPQHETEEGKGGGSHVRECCGRTLNLTLCSNFAVNRKICHARPRHSAAPCCRPLPTLASCACPMPHAACRTLLVFPTHVAKVLRMFCSRGCSCLFVRAEQKVLRRFRRVRKRKCATAARKREGIGVSERGSA